MVFHVIPRSEVSELLKLPRVILYGRRKVGKSFLVRRFLNPTHYFFVLRSGDLIYLHSKGRGTLSYGEFAKLFEELVGHSGYFIVIDEFQRLPSVFIDLLHFLSGSIKAKLYLVGSSMGFTQRILAARSPLLGLFQVYRLDLIRCKDIYIYFKDRLAGKELAKALVFLRDPWLLQFYTNSVDDAVTYSLRNIPGLIGEIFAEEDRTLTRAYERIIRAIAMGNHLPKDIASYTSKPLNEVKPYLYNLMNMGLVKRIKVYGKRKWLYKIRSPIIDLYYYLDTKYGISELEVERKTIQKEITEKLPHYFEDYIREALAEKHGGQEEKSLDPEIDVIITVRGKPIECAEVKLGRKTRHDEIMFLEKTARLDCKKTFITPQNIATIFDETSQHTPTPK